jgi:hypothetical protein
VKTITLFSVGLLLAAGLGAYAAWGLGFEKGMGILALVASWALWELTRPSEL